MANNTDLLDPTLTKPLRGTLNIKIDDNNYRSIYPLTSVDQVKNLDKRITSLLGKNIHADNLGNTTMDKLVVNELTSENGKPITAFVTDAVTACQTERDANMLEISDYVYSIKPVKYHDDQLWIKTGKDVANKELGTRFKINYVENAQKDNNNIPLNSYINSIQQTEENTLTFLTGEQVAQKSNGTTFTINHVETADKATSDELGNNIYQTYAQKDHAHSIDNINGFDKYITENIKKIINELLIEGKIQVTVNTVNMCQYPQYDFDINDSVTIPLNKNTIYNRPAPEILKLDTETSGKTNFNYKFDANNYLYNRKYIDDQGKLINNKTLSFGSPRKLADGFISYSGIITLDDISSINYIDIK